MKINHLSNYKIYNDGDEDITIQLLWEVIKLNTKYQDLDLYIVVYPMDVLKGTDNNP